MNRNSPPKKQPVPFGTNGQRENLLEDTPAGDNTASYSKGFPPVTMILKAAGGLPPKGQDMNQILFELSDLMRWASTGALNSFDAEFSSAIGGYPSGAIVLSDAGDKIFISVTNNNTDNPNSTNAATWENAADFIGISQSVQQDIDGKADLTQTFLLKGPLGASDLNTITGTDNQGIWTQGATANATLARNYPVVSAGSLEVIYNAAYGVGMVQRYTTFASNQVFIRFKARAEDAWSAWAEHWTSANLPNPATLDTAQTISGQKTFSYNGSGLFIKPASASQPGYIRGLTHDNSNHWFVGKGDSTFDVVLANQYSTAQNNILLAEDGSIRFTVQTGRLAYIRRSNTNYAILASDLNAVADANGIWKVPGSAGLTPDSIGALSVSDMAGMPQAFPGQIAPAGWLKCNGQSFNTTEYPVLASRYPSGFLPDLRGEFIRGWDEGRGVDTGRALLSVQGDAIRNITGKFANNGLAWAEGTTSSEGEGAFTRLEGRIPSNNNFGTAGCQYTFDASKVVPTASENRPRNIAFNYIVRAA